MFKSKIKRVFAALACVCFVALISTGALSARTTASSRWTAAEREMLRALSLASLGPLPADPSNRVADDTAAARLGRSLFFDQRLSRNGAVSCATCHMPDKNFQDSRALGQGVGTAGRRTMPIAGTAFSPWQFWDGRADSQWEQALGPLESAVEHGGDRTQYAHLIASEYRAQYQSVFGALPEIVGTPKHASPVADSISRAAWSRLPAARQTDISRVYANIGKAIAAYERRIGFTPSRFDRYVQSELNGSSRISDTILTADEQAGLR
ncbi:MAG: cytochrome-c peroxidase, partial [Gemmatimonadaceae bacterium]